MRGLPLPLSSRSEISLSAQHADRHRPERPVLLAVDQQLGEGAGPPADGPGSLSRRAREPRLREPGSPGLGDQSNAVISAAQLAGPVVAPAPSIARCPFVLVGPEQPVHVPRPVASGPRAATAAPGEVSSDPHDPSVAARRRCPKRGSAWAAGAIVNVKAATIAIAAMIRFIGTSPPPRRWAGALHLRVGVAQRAFWSPSRIIPTSTARSVRSSSQSMRSSANVRVFGFPRTRRSVREARTDSWP